VNTGVPAGRLDAIPLVALVRGYQRTWLNRDLLAALTVWALLVPQKKPLRDFLERTGLLDEIGRDHVYPRVSDAVDAYFAEDTDPDTSR
jgi:MFS superfamily sulfate permease-like transporter